MPINNFAIADIVNRITLVLPSKFTKATDTTSNIYAFLYGIAAALKLDIDYIDELFRQTNLVSASGAYVDDYISSLTEIGRRNNETDADYKTRYYNYTYKYNCTKNGIKNIVLDIAPNTQFTMYDSSKRGGYRSDETNHARNYYDDPSMLSTYGAYVEDAFQAFIQFNGRPGGGSATYGVPVLEADNPILYNLCKVIDSARAAGIRIFLYYPAIPVTPPPPVTVAPSVSVTNSGNTDATHSFVTFTWGVATNATSYEFTYNGGTTIFSASGNSYTLIQAPGTTGTFSVRGINSNGAGPFGSVSYTMPPHGSGYGQSNYGTSPYGQ